MGCTNTKAKQPVIVSRLLINLQISNLLNVDLITISERPVTEYPFYNGRLKQIDWKQIVESNQLFYDPYWPADISCILDESMMRKPNVRKWETYVWKRPSEVYGEGNYTLYDNIDPNDIKQGECGDCYFLSGLASLAEYPERIQRIFLTN